MTDLRHAVPAEAGALETPVGAGVRAEGQPYPTEVDPVLEDSRP